MDFKSYVEQTIAALTNDKLRDITFECQLRTLSSNIIQLVWKKSMSDHIEIELGSISLEKSGHPKNQLGAIFSKCISATLHLKNQIQDLESICRKPAQDRQDALMLGNLSDKQVTEQTGTERHDGTLRSDEEEGTETECDMTPDAGSRRDHHDELYPVAVHFSTETEPTDEHKQMTREGEGNFSDVGLNVTQTAKLRGDVLIIAQSILLPATCIITYIIASSNNHVEKVLPYISDSGSWPPESCIFGFLLCFYSLCTLIVVYGRWKMVRMYDHDAVWKRLNNIALGAGFTAAMGVLVVATFQQTSVMVVHLIGAGLAFGSATVYMWMHSFISRSIQNIPGFMSWLLVVRFSFSFLTTFSVLSVPVFTVIAFSQNDESERKTHEPGTGKWDSSMEGYDMHVVASSMEWTMAFFASIFFLTYVGEFRHVYFGMPVLRFNTTQITRHTEGIGRKFDLDHPQPDHPIKEEMTSTHL